MVWPPTPVTVNYAANPLAESHISLRTRRLAEKSENQDAMRADDSVPASEIVEGWVF